MRTMPQRSIGAASRRWLSSLRLIKATGRVVVLRTLSKLYGLAGARVGYMMAPPEIVATLRKIRAPFSVNALAQAAAEAVLSDEG
jgi:histidinol-phosphate aminotransferase